MTITLLISKDGTAESTYTEAVDLSAVGAVTDIRRASHVEPVAGGKWTADMSPVGGPVLGPFETRSLALDAEVAWLNENEWKEKPKC
jgi:hypothetical protein